MAHKVSKRVTEYLKEYTYELGLNAVTSISKHIIVYFKT